jgi:formylglycine-generating enzyme required for sulfatase activity
VALWPKKFILPWVPVSFKIVVEKKTFIHYNLFEERKKMIFDFLFKSKKERELSPDFINKLQDDFVLVPGGSFLMGSNEGEDDERPIHNSLVESFLMCKYEVTQQQWIEVMDTKPWQGLKYVNECDQCPVVNVDWYDVRNFIKQLNKRSGEHFRLPTEAEWEYACRAESITKYAHGSYKMNLTQYAWFYDNAFKKGEMRAQEVGTRKPNKWGLYDMMGNVYEWCSDWYSRNYYNKSPVQTPKGPMYGSYKVVRGGDWARTDYFLRASSRRYYSPHYKDVNVGFRLAKNNNKKDPIEKEL